MNTRKPNNGANVGGNDLFGHGAGKGAHQAGRGATNLGKKGARGLARHHHPVKGAEKDAGRAGQVAGLAGQGAGKGLNAAGKGTQAAGKALGSIPYVGPALGGAVGGLGKGMSAGGKGLDKGSKQLRNFSKKLKDRGKRGHLAKLAAWSSVHLFGLVGCFMVLLMLLGALLGAEMFMEDDEGSQCGGSTGAVSTDIGGAAGAWTQKGTKPYNLAKSIYQNSISLGCDANTAAGLIGNAESEGARQGNPMQGQEGVSPSSPSYGKGIFQFTPPSSNKTGWSVRDQVKEMLRRGVKKHNSSVTAAYENVLDVEDPANKNQPIRNDQAHKAYRMFNHLGGASDANDTADSASSSCGSSVDSGGLSGVVAYAKKWLHKLPYSNGDRDAGAEAVAKGNFGGSHDGADCSSFVWGVLRHEGFKTTPQPWTGNIYPPCKQISKSQAQPGDVAILGNKDSGDNGHVMILLTKWYGENNKTKVIDEGGDGSDVNISGFHDACASILYQPLHLVAPVKA